MVPQPIPHLSPRYRAKKGEYMRLEYQRDVQVLHDDINAEERPRYPP